MRNPINYPFLVFVVTFLAMFFSAWIGAGLSRRGPELEGGVRQDFDVILTAVLTLLGLVIGFSFSMAITRYDQRKNYEEAEANAIGTEYVRADLLPAADAEKVRGLLKEYLDQRILFYKSRDREELRKIAARNNQLQTQMWSVVKAPSGTQPTPLLALVVSGMNDVLNSQGYTQAAWWNRIPLAAWCLMIAMAICSNILVGYGTHREGGRLMRLLVLPFILGIAFFAIADIDSPRRGVIQVHPQNLVSLAESLQGN
jgi:hypothetical protein